MNKYICKIATLDELNEKWDYNISIHNDKNRWRVFKENAVNNHNTGKAILYIGKLNDEIICEATANLDVSITQNSEGLVNENTAYLTAFRTNKEFEGQGYFSRLYKFMEADLKSRGINTLTLGVEPTEERNLQIYTKWGYTNFIKSAYEIYPPDKKGGKSLKILVNYYSKEI